MSALASDGKNLEQLVAFVEETLVPQGFEVKTNERIFDETGVPVAEFDVQIQGKLGSTEINWLIECRDRPSSGPQTAAWIEQLVGRRQRFKFNKVTAVSTTGFAADARNYAEQTGIELREVESISAEEFKPWLDLTHMMFVTREHRLEHADIFLMPPLTADEQEIAANYINSLKGDARLLRSSLTNAPSSTQEAFIGATNTNQQLWESVVPNGDAKKILLKVVYDRDEDHFLIDIGAKAFRVESIVFRGALSLKETPIPARGVRYGNLDSEQPIAEIAKFEGMAGNEKISLEPV